MAHIMFMPQTINQTNGTMADIAFNLCLFLTFFLFGWMEKPTTDAWWLFSKKINGQDYFWDIGRTNINDVRLFRDFGNHGQGTHRTKMCLFLARKYPKYPKIYSADLPNPQKVQDRFEKKNFIGLPQSVNTYEKCAMRSS